VLSPDDPDYRMNMRLISDESAYLERLVSDLLVFSRMMDTGKALLLEPCSITAAIHQILAESREIAVKPAVEAILDLQEVPKIEVDKEKITFAIKQVIDNAFKFSGEEGEVRISLHHDPTDIILVVTDTGNGIPSEEIPKIFEKFYQIDPHNTGQVRGFGLGLYYAREFLRMHDGSISIENAEGRGTKVTVTLPLKKM
jgi:signal transduction histidine kinase